MATKSYLAVLVDLENNADGWWTALREHYPRFARVLSHDGHAVIARNLWAQLEALPGFADGPDYAPTALIDCGNEGSRWADVVAGRHSVFDSLE
jgi:hypothetical protein